MIFALIQYFCFTNTIFSIESLIYSFFLSAKCISKVLRFCTICIIVFLMLQLFYCAHNIHFSKMILDQNIKLPENSDIYLDAIKSLDILKSTLNFFTFIFSSSVLLCFALICQILIDEEYLKQLSLLMFIIFLSKFWQH